jgi:hypothetical protein
MDSIGIVAIIAGITGLEIAILTHVKHSDCYRLCNLETRSNRTSKEPSEIIEKETNVFMDSTKVGEALRISAVKIN